MITSKTRKAQRLAQYRKSDGLEKFGTKPQPKTKRPPMGVGVSSIVPIKVKDKDKDGQ